MPVKVDITRKFVVNGREYGSMDELPQEVREVIQKSISSGKVVDISRRSSIEFNGKEYKNAAEMPSDERRVYEQAMKLVGPQDPDSKEFRLTGKDMAISQIAPKPAGKGRGSSLSFSLAPVFALLIIAVAAAVLYFYFV